MVPCSHTPRVYPYWQQPPPPPVDRAGLPLQSNPAPHLPLPLLPLRQKQRILYTRRRIVYSERKEIRPTHQPKKMLLAARDRSTKVGVRVIRSSPLKKIARGLQQCNEIRCNPPLLSNPERCRPSPILKTATPPSFVLTTRRVAPQQTTTAAPHATTRRVLAAHSESEFVSSLFKLCSRAHTNTPKLTRSRACRRCRRRGVPSWSCTWRKLPCTSRCPPGR